MNQKRAKQVIAKLQAIHDEGVALVAEVSALNAAGQIAFDGPRIKRMNELSALADKRNKVAEKINASRRWN